MPKNNPQFIEYYENNEPKQTINKDLTNYTAQSSVVKHMIDYLNEQNKEIKKEEIEEEGSLDFCYLKTDGPNQYIIQMAKQLGGKWIADKGLWQFNSIVKDQVEEINRIVKSEKLIVEVTALKHINLSLKPFYFMGYQLFYIVESKDKEKSLSINRDIQFITPNKPNLIQTNKTEHVFIPQHSAFRIKVPSLLFDKTLDKVNPYELHVNIIEENNTL